MRNVNDVLGWGHARVIENLLERLAADPAHPVCQKAIADQFGNERIIREALMKRGRQIQLVQRHKAEADLAVDRSGAWRPCRKGEEPLVRRGEVYLHDASGARKSTGSYFTKSFAVEHLLERSLEPELQEHLARLDALGEDEAGERFFDFRVADLCSRTPRALRRWPPSAPGPTASVTNCPQ